MEQIILKRGKWCVRIKGRQFKFNTKEEALKAIGGDPLVEEVAEAEAEEVVEELKTKWEDTPEGKPFWKPWEK